MLSQRWGGLQSRRASDAVLRLKLPHFAECPATRALPTNGSAVVGQRDLKGAPVFLPGPRMEFR